MSSWVQEGLRELGYGVIPVTKFEPLDPPFQVSTYEGEEWQPRWSDVKEEVKFKPEFLSELLEYSMKLPCGRVLTYSRMVENWAEIKRHPSMKRYYIDDAKYQFAKEGGWKMSEWVD